MIQKSANHTCCNGLCENLLHPFQQDAGVSQLQRKMDDLLGENVKIDARKTADLLDYFYQLSKHLNYYDTNLVVSDWSPFFEKSPPFALAAVIKYNSAQVNESFDLYKLLFTKKPTTAGLQLLQVFIAYNTVKKINNWYQKIKGTSLPAERVFESIIKDKLRQPLLSLLALNQLAAKWFCIQLIDFSTLYADDIWGLNQPGLLAAKTVAEDNSFINGDCNRLTELYNRTIQLFASLAEPIKILATAAELSLEQSILPLNEELQKKHAPHLGLLFAFLKLFEKLQSDLNGYTKKHLDFFYKEVLKIKPRKAVPDQAHIVFEIQKALESYSLAKGLQLKDGKDVNKEEIVFSLEDEIVVNQAQVKEVKTLYLNNTVRPDPNPLNKRNNMSVTEGVYIASDATAADGIDKDFQTEVKNFYTVGNKESKYILPGTTVFKPHANARLGFILASPVLLLSGGTRTINVTIACELELPTTENDADGLICKSDNNNGEYLPTYSMAELFQKVKKDFRKYFVYISEELIQQAIKKGISANTIDILRNTFLQEDRFTTVCDQIQNYYKSEISIDWNYWLKAYYKNVIPTEKDVIDELFKRQHLLKVVFSGEKEWIEPDQLKKLRFTTLTDTGNTSRKNFAIKFSAVIADGKPGVTFFNKEKLKEDYDTTQPLMKIEMNDKIKIMRGFNPPKKNCCLGVKFDNSKIPISFYYFFKHVKILESTVPDVSEISFKTKISVAVCGLKNFIVQNDESVMDVSSPVYPFGTRPKVNANFYIGSEEIFLKHWSDVWVNMKWKDYPENGFETYYNGYQYDYRDEHGTPIKQIGQIKEENFKIKSSLLQDGYWYDKTGGEVCDVNPKEPEQGLELLFPKHKNLHLCFENSEDKFNALYSNQLHYRRQDFNTLPLTSYKVDMFRGVKRFDVNSREGFLRIRLKCQDFQHDKYSVVLARQLAAEGKLNGEKGQLVDGAVYYNIGDEDDFKIISIKDIFGHINEEDGISKKVRDELKALIDEELNLIKTGNSFDISINDEIWQALFRKNLPGLPLPNDQDKTDDSTLFEKVKKLLKLIDDDKILIDKFEAKGVVMPNVPWTPTTESIVLDYTATATAKDIDLIHLYPFAGTYKHEEIQLQPTLFPTFCDEGTLFIGLEKLKPGNNLNVLFQLAEATADSESGKEDVHWHFLDNNVWKPLRTGFEILNDATEDLTTTGIIKFALPENMTDKNTVMPTGLHWIKATIPANSRSVSETTGIYTQAIKALFTNTAANDKMRLNKPIEASQIAKLLEADANVKKVSQPYESFGGQIPEEQGMFYVRVSELLRHKGRAIQKFDYERIVLDAFPQLFKAKCINHSFGLNAHLYTNDFPYAPGYVIMAVIPDLFKLKAGNAFEPTAPLSLLEKIDAYVRNRTSAFVRFRAMNPRYEKVHLSLKVKLIKGKDPNYYQEKLKEDIREFLAPWAVGEYYKIAFGQCVRRSDIIRFIESTDYVDFILKMNMYHECDTGDEVNTEVCPHTPRSILIAGDVDVCIEKDGCENWDSREQCDAANTHRLAIDCKEKRLNA